MTEGIPTMKPALPHNGTLAINARAGMVSSHNLTTLSSIHLHLTPANHAQTCGLVC